MDEAKIAKPNTKTVANLLKKLEVYGKKVLFILDDKQELFVKSARNINKVVVKKFDQTSTTDVMNAKVLIIEAKACDGLGKVYC